MKRKWLVGIASAALAVTLTFGFAACGGGDKSASDEDIVNDMVDTLNIMYADADPLTPTSYTVTHSIVLDGEKYTIDWSVAAVTEGITLSDFVEVGAVDEAQNTVTIVIKQNTQVVDYTLNGSFKVGKATGSVSYDRQIPQIYNVAGVKALVEGFTNQQYYKVNDEVVSVVVRGYVVSTGEWSTQHNNFQKVYIADSATETSKSNECQIYGLELDGVYLTAQEDLVEGALITVQGALQYYNGPEITFYNDKNIKPYAVAYELPSFTDEEIVDRAIAKLTIPQSYIAEGEHTLPTELEGATIAWAVTAGGEYASVTGGTLTLTNLPAADAPAEITLTATVSYGEAHKDTAFTVKAYKSSITHAGTQEDPYTPAEANELAQTLANGTYYEVDGTVVEVYVKGRVVHSEWAASYGNFNYVYLLGEDDYTANATKDTAGTFMVYRIAKNDMIPTEGSLAHGDTIVVKGNLQNHEGSYQLGHSGDSTSSSTLVEYISGMTAKQKADAAVTEAKAAIPTTLTADFDLPTSRFDDVELSFSSNNDAIKVQDGKLVVTRPTDAAATVTITITAECGEETSSDSVTVTVPKGLAIPQDAVTATVTIAEYASAHNWVNNENGNSMSVDVDTNITATMSGTQVGTYGLNTGKYNSKTETWRIYQNESPTLHFEAKNGAHIYTIKITYLVDKGGILSSTDKLVNYASEEVIEVDATEISFTVGQTGTANNGQVQITAIEVVYSGGTELGPEQKLAAAVTALNLEKVTFTEVGETVTLPATGINNTTITWTVAQNTYFTQAENVLTVSTLPAKGAEDATVTVTASVSIEGVDAPTTKEFTLTVVAPIEEVYTPLEAPAEGNYILALYQGDLKKWLFSTGATTTNSAGTFGATTEDKSEAAFYILTSVSGGWTIQLASDKTYFELNSAHQISYVSESTQAWKWNDTYKVFTFDVSGTTYYIGTYGTYNTFSASTISYLSGDTNYPAKFGSVDLTEAQMNALIDSELNAVAATLSVLQEGNVTLPASKNSKVIFSWALKAENSYPSGTTLEGGILKVESLPTEEATFTLVLTATYQGTETSKTKDVTVTISAAPANDDDKVAQAKGALTLSDTVLENDGDTITLPATSGEVTVSWAIQGETSEYIDLQGNTVSVKHFPEDEDKQVTLVATFTLNEAHDTQTYTITVKRHINYGTENAPISVTAALAIAAEQCQANNSWSLSKIYVTGKVKATPTGSAGAYTFTLVDLSDAQKEIEIYKMNEQDLPAPMANDTVVIYGWIENYFGNTLQFTGYAGASKEFPVLVKCTGAEVTITLGAHDGADVTGFDDGDTKTAKNHETFSFTVNAQQGKRILAVKVNDSAIQAKEGSTYEFTVAGAATVTVETGDIPNAAQEVLESLNLDGIEKVYSAVDNEGTTVLPTTSEAVTKYSATVEWTIEGGESDYVSISANKIIIKKLPTGQDAKVTLKVSISASDTTAEGTIEITVKKEVDPNHKEGTYTITESSVTGFTNTYQFYDWEATDSNGTLKGKLYAYKDVSIQFNGSKEGCSIVNTVATPGPIVSVKITTQTGETERSWKLFTNSSPYSETDKKPTAGTDHGAQTAKTTGTTWTVSDANAYFFTLVEQDTSASKIDSIEITYSGTPMTDEVKATAALNAITFEETELKEDVTLPTSVIEGVTFTWTTEDGGEAAKVENNTTLKIVRQDDDVDFTLKVTATSGNHTTEARSISLKVVAKPAEGVKESKLLYTLTPTIDSKATNYAGSGTATIDGIKWTVEGNMNLSGPAWGFGGKNLTKVDRKLTSSTALSGTVKKLIITFGQASNVTINSATLKVYSSDPLGDSPTLVSTESFTVTANSAVTVEAPADSDWTNSYFQIIFNVTVSGNSNKRIDLKGIEFHGYAAD